MVATQGDYASQMIAALAVSDPDLDTSIGSVSRKIIDSVAEVASLVEVDKHLLASINDVDAKTGSDLDDYLLGFGFERFAAKRATGIVTFRAPTAVTQDVPIPDGTQVVTSSGTLITFVATVPAFISQGQLTADVPVMALVGGAAGNLPANSITLLATALTNISAQVTNVSPTSGGTDIESDDSFRERFKKTVFRSLAGTEDMFRGVSLEDTTPDKPEDTVAKQVQVIGATKRWSEQVQVGNDGTATSTIPTTNYSYIYPDSSVFGTAIELGSILTPNIHYTFDAFSSPPKIVGVGSALTPGSLYDLDFEYTPMASRNDPLNGVTNRVDVWVDGSFPTQASETCYFRSVRTFTGNVGDTLLNTKFVRQDTNDAHPSVGNYFVQLAYGPITSFPNSLLINGVTHTKGVDYWVVHDDTAFGYSPSSLFGLEWRTGHTPPNNYAIPLIGESAYYFNRLPRDVEERVRQWRLVSFDVRAHAARVTYLKLGLAVMFVPSFDRQQTTDALSAALSSFLSQRGFGTPVQVSDLLQAGHAVEGIDNIRLLRQDEVANGEAWGIQRVASNGTFLSQYQDGNGRPVDVILGDDQVTLLSGINVQVKAQNTWRSY